MLRAKYIHVIYRQIKWRYEKYASPIGERFNQ